MTHSLHRAGSKESLQDDYVWQVYPSPGINDFDVPNRLQKVIDIVTQVGSPNWGDVYTGCTAKVPVDQIRQGLRDGSKLRGVLTSKRQVNQFLQSMKEADIGFSVVISGLIGDILDACRQTGLKPHTVNLSLGVWGKKELLPDENVLEITTMCGHHMISPQIVEKSISDLRRGKKIEKAVEDITKMCACGIFNNIRAQRLIREQVIQL